MQTKKYFLAAIASLMMLSSFKADKVAAGPTKSNDPGMPHQLTGKWLNGTFSMSNWWSYDGKKYIGNPYTRSVAFNFTESGEAEFFLIIKTHSGYCSTEAFTYQQGKVKFNDADHSFTIYPDKGNYRGFYSCAAGSNFDRAAKPEELKAATYYWSMEKDESGQQWMVIRFSPDKTTAGSYFKQTTW